MTDSASPAEERPLMLREAEGALLAFIGGAMTGMDDETRKAMLDRAEYHIDRLVRAASVTDDERLRHIRDIASGYGGDDASRSDPHNALATIVVLCDAALASATDDERHTPDEEERRDLATLRRLLPVIVDDRTAETWLAFGRIEKALGHGVYGDTAPSREKQR